MKNEKRKTLVIDIINNKETVCNSRWDACRLVGMERKYLNFYIKKGVTFKKQYKFLDL
jgi:hypothetical protein